MKYKIVKKWSDLDGHPLVESAYVDLDGAWIEMKDGFTLCGCVAWRCDTRKEALGDFNNLLKQLNNA